MLMHDLLKIHGLILRIFKKKNRRPKKLVGRNDVVNTQTKNRHKVDIKCDGYIAKVTVVIVDSERVIRKFLKCFKEFVLPSVSLLNKITEGNTDIMKTANLLFIKMEVRQRT